MNTYTNTYLVITQTLENYGAHDKDGRFSSGNAHWKFKGGNDYIITGVQSIQDAVAFVAAKCSNSIGFKEFPVQWEEVSADYQTTSEKQQLEYEGEIRYPADRINVQEALNAKREALYAESAGCAEPVKKTFQTMTTKEIFALGEQIRAEGGWTMDQYLSHPSYAYSKEHTGRYATKGAHTVYFMCSDSPSGRVSVGGYTKAVEPEDGFETAKATILNAIDKHDAEMVADRGTPERLDREHGSPYDRGHSDAYYGRSKSPHFYVGASYVGDEITRLTSKEAMAYNEGFDGCEDFKDWGCSNEDWAELAH